MSLSKPTISKKKIKHQAFGLGYKATDFAFQELELVKSTSSYAQDLYVVFYKLSM